MNNNIIVSLYKKVVSEYRKIRESDLHNRLLAMNEINTLIYIDLSGLEPFLSVGLLGFDLLYCTNLDIDTLMLMSFKIDEKFTTYVYRLYVNKNIKIANELLSFSFIERV